MSIKTINLNCFTVFNSVECDFSPGINIFIGENSTGKTHLMKVLYVFCKSVIIESNRLLSNGAAWLDNFSTVLSLCFQEQIPKLLRKRNSGELTCVKVSTAIREHCFYLTVDNPNFKPSLQGDDKLIKDKLPSIFIPAKDMLTHARGLISMTENRSKDMPFDSTLLDIIKNAEFWKLDEVTILSEKMLKEMEVIIGGQIVQENGDFYVVKADGSKTKFSVEAEGVKKIGLLWQLIMNGVICKDSVLFWDEPEANLNPTLIPVIVDILIELSNNGVQIFLATHDYMFAKYFEVKEINQENIRFHSLYKTENGIACESGPNFRDLKNNPIISAFDVLLDEVISKNVGD